jgi:hypothetical protein
MSRSLQPLHLGHAAVATNPEFRSVLAAHGFNLDPETSEVRELAPYVGAFSARAAQICRNLGRYEAGWRHEHPGEEPGPRLRDGWDRRAWADARLDKVAPPTAASSWARWNGELRGRGCRDATGPVPLTGTRPGWIDRDAAADLVVSILGAERSARNAADIRGKTEVLLAQTCLLADPAARAELAEDITARAADRCIRLLTRTDVPEHVRHLSSPQVLEVEADLVARIARRADKPARKARVGGRGLVQDRPDPDRGGRRPGRRRTPRPGRRCRGCREDHRPAVHAGAAVPARASVGGRDADVEGRAGRRRRDRCRRSLRLLADPPTRVALRRGWPLDPPTEPKPRPHCPAPGR